LRITFGLTLRRILPCRLVPLHDTYFLIARVRPNSCIKTKQFKVAFFLKHARFWDYFLHAIMRISILGTFVTTIKISKLPRCLDESGCIWMHIFLYHCKSLLIAIFSTQKLPNHITGKSSYVSKAHTLKFTSLSWYFRNLPASVKCLTKSNETRLTLLVVKRLLGHQITEIDKAPFTKPASFQRRT